MMFKALFLVPLLVSCTSRVPAPKFDLSGEDPQVAWARNLHEHVDDAGAIDFEGMAENSADLDRVVAWIAQPRTPELVGSAELAYLINAYNALAMYGVLHAGLLPESKVRFFYLREFEENGREISLYDFENDVIRGLGDARIHFALNCMVRACPRLPRVPFRGETLDQQLDAAAREFLGDPRHVQLDVTLEVVRFSRILDWYAEDFLEVAPSLIAYANRYREEPIPLDWSVEFLEYDWSLNQSR